MTRVPAQIPSTILPIQILRAVAAGLVVMHHAQFEAAGLALRTGQTFVPSTLLPWAGGVDVFFVISGFIIVHANRHLADRPGGRGRFLAHRVARVVPLYWLVSALYLAVALVLPAALSDAGGATDPAYVAAAFLFWPAARPDGAVLPLYGLGWTLNCEMAFYGLFALGLGFGHRAAVAWIVAALLAIVLAGAWVAPASAPLAFWSNPVMLEFALGAGIALARGEGFVVGRRVRIGTACAGLALLAFVARETAFPEGFARPLLLGVPAALLVAAAALGRPPPPVATPRGPARVGTLGAMLAALGDASYALYLVHPFALRGLREALTRLGLATWLGPSGALWAMLIVSIAAALVVHRCVERPMMRALRTRLDARAGLAREKRVSAEEGRVPRCRDPH